MIHDPVSMPLRKMIERASFRKNVTDIFVTLFNTGFLPCTHRVAVINAGTNDIVNTGFQGVWIREFSTAICDDYLDNEQKTNVPNFFSKRSKTAFTEAADLSGIRNISRHLHDQKH